MVWDGAPMCGCLESMPSVSNSACIEAKEGYKFDAGTITANVKFGACAKDTLAAKMEAMADNEDIPAVSSFVATRRTTDQLPVIVL